MDTLFNFLNWALILGAFSFSFAFSEPASAEGETIPATQYYRGWYATETDGDWTTNAQVAAQYLVGNRNDYGYGQSPQWGACGYSYHSGIAVYGVCIGSGDSPVFVGNMQTQFRCPSGYTLSGTSCTPDVPPPPDCQDKAGQQASAGLYDIGTSPTNSLDPVACDGSCQVVFSGDSPAYTNLSGGVRHYYASGAYDYTGDECSGGSGLPAALASPPPDTCGEGQAMGTYQGKTTCVNVSTGQPAPTTPPPPETETEETDPPVTNPDGSTTQTTTRTHSDGSSTTTTTTTNPDGSTTTSVVRNPAPGEDQLDSYCESNPDATICKEEESSWSGSCGSFACEGDAVQCAIAKKIHEDRCADSEAVQQFTGAIERGEQLLNGEYGEDVDAYLAGTSELTNTVHLPSVLSETGDANLPSAGLTDLAVAFQGQTVTIPFSKLNSILEMLGYVILACAYVSALRIVGVF